MKLRNILYSAVGVLGLSLASTSCSDYLDISGEFNASVGEKDVWDNYGYTKDWYGVVYRDIVEYSWHFNQPWPNMCGEISAEKATSRDIMTAGFTSSSAGYHRWDNFYKDIRQAMMFIEKANDEGVGDPSSQSYLSPKEISRMKDECRFMQAYYYFMLFQMYGPACIVTEIDDPAEPHITDYKRATVDEYVNFVDDILAPLCDPSRSNLAAKVINTFTDNNSGGAYTFNEKEVVRPTIVTARALRAKLWMYAASKLFNGGDGSEYAQKLKEIKNEEGEFIFPQQKDLQKWVKAKQYVKELIDYAEANHHSLYKYVTNNVADPNRSIYNLFQVYNQEILWCSTLNYYADKWNMEPATCPRDVNSSWGTFGPTQDAVDMFFTKNGLTIDEDPTYNESGFSDVENKCYDYQFANTKTDNNIFNMYANREPRFYANVIYQGRSWFKSYQDRFPNYMVDFSTGGGNDMSNSDNVRVGYMLGKFKNRSIDWGAGGSYDQWYRVSIIYRLAEFYLYYAEACNEIDPGDPEIIKYIDKVRERAGIPTYAQLQADGIKNISNDYDKQFDAIQHERYVELYCEGERYFDIRRWMIAAGQGKWKNVVGVDQTRFYGMNMKGSKDAAIGDASSFYKRTQLENRLWFDKYYLYPIAQNVVELSAGKVPQNPGW